MLEQLTFLLLWILYMITIICGTGAYLNQIYKKWNKKEYRDVLLLLVLFIVFWIAFGGVALLVCLGLGAAAHVPFLPYWLAS